LSALPRSRILLCGAAAGIFVAGLLLADTSLGEPKSTERKSSPPAARSGKSSAPSPSRQPETVARQRELQGEQRELQAELAKLKRQLAANEASYSEATDALAELEADISATNRRLRDLASARLKIEEQLTALERRERDVAQRQAAQEGHLAALFRQQQAVTLRDPLHLLLAGQDPGQLTREAEYLTYLSRAADRAVVDLRDRREELSELKAQSEQKRSELIKITEDEQQSRKQLEQENARRKRTLDQLAKQIAAQRQSIGRLERDEKRLNGLIERLAKLLAEQARQEAERTRRDAERARDATARARPPAATATPPRAAEGGLTAPNLPLSSSNFGQRKGKLALPIEGTITARFGATRRGEGGAAGPTWKGIFIRAPSGTEVRAVGDGRVVFSDWLRGFGNLLVIDHGDGFLSIYGNNEALLRNVGDPVAVGVPVALVGNTGGNEHPGLYFELRFQGRPFDPLTWVAAR
jgi:septal ring factor EnvC (AmiA/AmiB activator)